MVSWFHGTVAFVVLSFDEGRQEMSKVVPWLVIVAIYQQMDEKISAVNFNAFVQAIVNETGVDFETAIVEADKFLRMKPQ